MQYGVFFLACVFCFGDGTDVACCDTPLANLVSALMDGDAGFSECRGVACRERHGCGLYGGRA